MSLGSKQSFSFEGLSEEESSTGCLYQHVLALSSLHIHFLTFFCPPWDGELFATVFLLLIFHMLRHVIVAVSVVSSSLRKPVTTSVTFAG